MNDRYAIYKMLNSRFSWYHGDSLVEGEISDVCRDILEDVVKIRIDDVEYQFPEPDAVYQSDDGDITFSYGDDSSFDDSDDMLFDGLKVGVGSNINDFIKRNPQPRVKSIIFHLEPESEDSDT